GRWELLRPSVEDGADLVAGAPNRGRRRDELRASVRLRVCRKEVDRGLVQADERAERTRDQMQLVLDDEVRRGIGARGRASAEEATALLVPRKHGELVDRANDQRGALVVDVLVDETDG